ncbi:hypothetical protein McanMca71_007479 [Microsporum canis]
MADSDSYEPGYRKLNRNNVRFEYSDTPTVNLKKQHQQYQPSFYGGIKALARRLNIWDLVNPDLKAEPEYTTLPKKVEYKDANPQATSIQDLTEDQLEMLRFLKEDYKEQQLKEILYQHSEST